MTSSPSNPIYKICPQELWDEAVARGRFDGAPVDLQDGYVHFSTEAQISETATRHFAGQAGLLLIAVDGNALGSALRWEPSRGGDLFPHLYGPLPVAAAFRVWPLPLGADGDHVFPDLPA